MTGGIHIASNENADCRYLNIKCLLKCERNSKFTLFPPFFGWPEKPLQHECTQEPHRDHCLHTTDSFFSKLFRNTPKKNWRKSWENVSRNQIQIRLSKSELFMRNQIYSHPLASIFTHFHTKSNFCIPKINKEAFSNYPRNWKEKTKTKTVAISSKMHLLWTFLEVLQVSIQIVCWFFHFVSFCFVWFRSFSSQFSYEKTNFYFISF